MSLWDPHAFTPTGEAVGPVAPPSLRVYGAPATTEQLGMAQAAFYRFSMARRVSVVPNPTESGSLADGSRYRIVVLGNMTIMELWPVAGDQDERLSGIGVIFTDLEGNPLPGHTRPNDDETPQSYILTPKEHRGTRNTTGQWRVRKVRDYNGGKAAFQFVDRNRYLTGVGGNSFVSLPIVPGGNGLQPTLNYRAYRFGALFEGAKIYAAGKEVATFASDTDTLPFFRMSSDGELWIMRIAIAGAGYDQLELYGEKYSPDRTGPILDLLYTLNIPDVYVARWDFVSPSPDGKKLRMVFYGDGFTAVDIAVGDRSLAIVSTSNFSSTIPGSVDYERTGDDDNFTVRERIVSDVVVGGVGYGFDAKGRGVKITTGGGLRINENGTTQTFSRTVTGEHDWIDDVHRTSRELETDAGGYVDLNGRKVSFPVLTTRDIASELTEHKEYVDGVFVPASHWATGFRRSRQESFSALGVIFFDPTTEFVVFAQRVTVHDYTGVVVSGSGAWHYEPPESTGTVVTNRGDVAVMCRGQTVLSLDIEDRSIRQYTVSAAADPLTGAILANLLEFDSPSRTTVTRSWVFLVDDHTCKRLHEVMKVPESGVMVKNDRTLLSV